MDIIIAQRSLKHPDAVRETRALVFVVVPAADEKHGKGYSTHMTYIHVHRARNVLEQVHEAWMVSMRTITHDIITHNIYILHFLPLRERIHKRKRPYKT